MTESSVMHKKKENIKIQMLCNTTFYSVLLQLILYVNNNHWISAAGNKNNEVSVYDSKNGNLSQEIVYVIARIFKCEDEEFMVTPIITVQHRTNGNGCGLFALAFTTEDIDPS